MIKLIIVAIFIGIATDCIERHISKEAKETRRLIVEMEAMRGAEKRGPLHTYEVKFDKKFRVTEVIDDGNVVDNK